MGDHHMAWKGLFLEGSAHVPLIVKPAYAHLPVEARELGGKSCDHLVNHADLLPTCLAAAGILPPKELNCEGFDLIKNIEGESPRKSLIGNFSHHHMVRDDQYKYMYTSLDGIELLFDMQNDPMEQRELIRTGLHEDVRKRMRKKLIESLTRRGHEAVKNGNLVITGKAPSYKEIKRSPWPGFHTTAERSDVLH